MTNYYFLASLLPALRIGEASELPFRELDKLLTTNITGKDYEAVKVVKRYYDVENVRSYWLGEEISPYGNLDHTELEEAFVTGDGLPAYVYDFLDRFDKEEDRLHHFPSLISSYFNEELPGACGFLYRYLLFEREWRLVTTAFRAKSLGRDVGQELQYEDFSDDLVAQILAQKDAKAWQLPERFDTLLEILETNYNNPMLLHRALCEWRFEKLYTFAEVDFFSINRILRYLTRLMIVEQWLEQNKETGLAVVDTIVKEAS